MFIHFAMYVILVQVIVFSVLRSKGTHTLTQSYWLFVVAVVMHFNFKANSLCQMLRVPKASSFKLRPRLNEAFTKFFICTNLTWHWNEMIGANGAFFFAHSASNTFQQRQQRNSNCAVQITVWCKRAIKFTEHKNWEKLTRWLRLYKMLSTSCDVGAFFSFSLSFCRFSLASIRFQGILWCALPEPNQITKWNLVMVLLVRLLLRKWPFQSTQLRWETVRKHFFCSQNLELK